MLNTDLQDIILGVLLGIFGFLVCLFLFSLLLPSPNYDYEKDRRQCEEGGGVWTEVVHNRDLSYCTYFYNGR